ncbi:unnamed protein product, partial [Vitis vinifera]
MAMILGFSTLRLLMIAGHDKASIFKVKAMEAVDTAIGQLSHLQCHELLSRGISLRFEAHQLQMGMGLFAG